MQVSKIHLSSTEIELLQNADIILTKNRVLEKMRSLLEEVQDQQTDFGKRNGLTNEIFGKPSKISRGENYLGLPYLILDYPRQSTKNDFFFIRTMFWWGNFFSCTLHLSGRSKDIFKESIKASYSRLSNFYINVNDDEWVHHLEEPHYRKIDLLTKKEFGEYCDHFDHLKIAAKYPLQEWRKASSELFEIWKFFLDLCELIS